MAWSLSSMLVYLSVQVRDWWWLLRGLFSRHDHKLSINYITTHRFIILIIIISNSDVGNGICFFEGVMFIGKSWPAARQRTWMNEWIRLITQRQLIYGDKDRAWHHHVILILIGVLVFLLLVVLLLILSLRISIDGQEVIGTISWRLI